jgi:hypothetical protein
MWILGGPNVGFCFWSSLHRPGCKDFFEFYDWSSACGGYPPIQSCMHSCIWKDSQQLLQDGSNIETSNGWSSTSWPAGTMKSKELGVYMQHASSIYIYIYIYLCGADDQLYMNIALFLQVRMAATKLQYSNNIDVGLVSHTHEPILYKIYLHMLDHHPGQQLNLLFHVLQMFLHYLSIYIERERDPQSWNNAHGG